MVSCREKLDRIRLASPQPVSDRDSYRASSYGQPVSALKSFILSSFTDAANVEAGAKALL